MCDRMKKTMPFVIILSGICGTVLQAFSGGSFSAHSFCMFTTLSNIYVVMYYIMASVHGGEGVYCPAWRFSAIISISLTGLVAAFMLGGLFAGASSVMKAGLFLLHDVVPVCVWLDYLAFADKGAFRRRHIAAGLMPALCYMIAAFVGAAAGHGLGMGESRYPYPFMDIDRLGVSRVALICSALGVAMAAGSALLVFADAKMHARKQALVNEKDN